MTTDSGALPGQRDLHAVCETAGLNDGDVRLLHAGSNIVYHLPREDLVVRLARATPVQVDRARKVVSLCRWLAAQHGPTLAPTDRPQPVLAASTVATMWPYLPPSTPPTPAALGATLRALHAITTPPPPDVVPPYQPLSRLREALDLDATRDTPALTADDHAWLTTHADTLRAAYVRVTSQLGTGLVHGDPHPDNLLHNPGTGQWVLIDFDHTARGPRELDLLFAAPDHFHEPVEHRAAFTRAYGHDLLSWPYWTVLRDISEAHSLASYIRRAPSSPAAATELTRRLTSLRTGGTTTHWTAIT